MPHTAEARILLSLHLLFYRKFQFKNISIKNILISTGKFLSFPQYPQYPHIHITPTPSNDDLLKIIEIAYFFIPTPSHDNTPHHHMMIRVTSNDDTGNIK